MEYFHFNNRTSILNLENYFMFMIHLTSLSLLYSWRKEPPAYLSHPIYSKDSHGNCFMFYMAIAVPKWSISTMRHAKTGSNFERIMKTASTYIALPTAFARLALRHNIWSVCKQCCLPTGMKKETICS